MSEAQDPRPEAYLGIDPSLKCGWSLLDQAGDLLESGVCKFDAYGRFQRWLECRALFEAHLIGRFVSKYRLVVAYEEVHRHEGIAAAHVYGGVVAHLEAACAKVGLTFRPIQVAHVKQVATGKGNAGKRQVYEAAVRKWKFKPQDDNEADALWIAETARLIGVGKLRLAPPPRERRRRERAARKKLAKQQAELF
jgi:Holliday junction resolvasome RuvABC endonuclease subunit